MGRVQRQLSRAHEQVLIIIVPEELIEGFKMSSLNHTKTLWQEPKWKVYSFKPTKVKVLKQVCMGYTEHFTVMVRVTWFDKWQPVQKTTTLIRLIKECCSLHKLPLTQHSVACVKIIPSFHSSSVFKFLFSSLSVWNKIPKKSFKSGYLSHWNHYILLHQNYTDDLIFKNYISILLYPW